MVSFRGIMKLKERPHKSPLGVKFQFSDEHSLPFHMGVPPGFPKSLHTSQAAYQDEDRARDLKT